MALNGSGVMLINSSGQPVVSQTLISAAVFNAFTADVATALSTAMYKDGQQTVIANIPMGGYKFTGLGAGANPGESVRYEQVVGVYLPLAGGTLSGGINGTTIPTSKTLVVTTDIGTSVQAYNANNAVTNAAQTFTASQRGTMTSQTSLTVDMNTGNKFKITPTAGGALTFSNIISGQGGTIIFVNGSNYNITAAATTKVTSTMLATISATGTYTISYESDGTNVFCSATGAQA